MYGGGNLLNEQLLCVIQTTAITAQAVATHPWVPEISQDRSVKPSGSPKKPSLG